MKWLRANWAKAVCGLALAAVAGVAGVVSYDHIEALTLALHQPLTIARLMPFGVDGLIVVGSVALLTATPGNEWLGWLGVGPGVAASVFANVESGLRWGWLAALWAGVPAGSFFLATFLLERWLKAQANPAPAPRDTAAAGTPSDTSGPVPAAVPDFAALDGHRAEAERLFAAEIEAGQVPGIRRIREGLRVGQPRAKLVQSYLRNLTDQ